MSETRVIDTIIALCEKLNQKQMLAAGDGNISYRCDDGKILITPRGQNKAFVSPDEFAAITLSNEIIRGEPSSERLMHLQVYNSCPQARCVVHAHPPHAIAWSIANPELKFLPTDALPEVILGIDAIPIVPYARPGTTEMAEALRGQIKHYRALILGRHGAIAWGESIIEAYNGIERIEHAAMVLQLADTLGGAQALPSEELAWLRKQRQQQPVRSL